MYRLKSEAPAFTVVKSPINGYPIPNFTTVTAAEGDTCPDSHSSIDTYFTIAPFGMLSGTVASVS